MTISQMRHPTLPPSVNQATGLVIDCAMTVHRELGPGMLEQVYLQCLVHELRSQGAQVETQVRLPVTYGGVDLDAAYRVDLIVNGEVVVEVKSVAQLLPVHQAQAITYLKLSRRPAGLLLNFNVALMKDGIVRLVL